MHLDEPVREITIEPIEIPDEGKELEDPTPAAPQEVPVNVPARV